ncbi:MAG: hypothetical protein KC493_12220 [Bacteriovoracaceae bacterium]|nr:hypothetical protein [Bacteriovoracaceae bacterium]
MGIKNISKFIAYLLLMSIFVACNGSGGDAGFSTIAESDTQAAAAPAAPSGDTTLSISSFTPAADPYTIGSTSETFAIAVSGNGSITYDFSLDSISVQSGSSPFYNLNGALLTVGTHTLVATATNSVNSVSHTFNIIKNSAPTIGSFTPPAGTLNLNCGVDSQAFSIFTSDVNGDAMTYAWTLNGSPAASQFSIVSTVNSSVATFSPTCTLNGSYTLTGTVSDGIDTSSTSWTVIVGNPNVASIDAYSPSLSPVVVLSTTPTQVLTVSASGNPPLVHAWKLDGTNVGTNSASYTFAETTAGAYTVDITVTDPGTTDSHSFSVIKNAKPALSNVTPASSTLKLNYASTKVFSIDASDANSDTMSYTWKLNGGTSSFLVGSATAGGSQAVFTPSDLILGQQIVSVEVSDGREITSQSWQVTVNRFRTSCNDLAADEICTVFGRTGLGDDSTTSSGTAIANPTSITGDGAGGFFVSDMVKDVVWYVNKTGSTQVRLGVTVENGKSKVVVGMGAGGISPEGMTGTSYKLNDPQGLAWHSARAELYVSDYNNHRIVRVTSSGVARKVAGGTTANNLAGHGAGLALSINMIYPYGIALDETSNTLYVGSYGGFIKKFDISDADYNNWTGEVVVGKRQANDTITETLLDGDIGYLTTGAQAQDITSLAISSNGKYLYFSDQAHCRIRVANMDSVSVEHFGVTVAAGTVGTLTPQNCGSKNEEPVATAQTYRAYSNALALHETAGVVKGFFLSSYHSHEIFYWNSSGVDQTFGGRTISDDNVGRVLGVGLALSSGDAGSGMNANIYYPRGVYTDGSKLYTAEYYGSRLRSLDISTTDGTVTTEALFTSAIQYIDVSDPGEALSYNLMSLGFNTSTNKMYFTSYSTGRISSINTITGETSWELGRGQSNAASYSQTSPSLAYVAYPRGLTFVDGLLLFLNWQNPGPNRNCNIGAYNDTGADKTIMNVLVNDGKLNQIAGGSYAQGCVAWDTNWSGDAANTTPLNSGEGLAYVDNSELLYADYRDHCIKKIDSSGNISVLVGQCGSAGNVNGLYNDVSVRLRYPLDIKEDPQQAGNFFFIDYGDSSTSSYVKYVNRTASNVTINGVTVLPGFLQTVYTINGGRGIGLDAKDDWVCASSSYQHSHTVGAHNIQCFDRATGNLNRIGPSSTDFFKNREAMTTEQEGVDSSAASLSGPRGIAFDQDGNLWAAEYNGGKIRMIKKWW